MLLIGNIKCYSGVHITLTLYFWPFIILMGTIATSSCEAALRCPHHVLNKFKVPDSSVSALHLDNIFTRRTFCRIK